MFKNFIRSSSFSKLLKINWQNKLLDLIDQNILYDLIKLNFSNVTKTTKDLIWKIIRDAEELDVSNGKVNSISAQTFDHFYDLKVLNLSSNNIRQIDEEIFELLYNLEELNLANNRLTCEQKIYGLYELKSLDLSSNEINAIKSNTFYILLNLVDLNLSKNQIKKIENEAFKHLKQLKKLDLSFNEIDKITYETFVHIENLEDLCLNGNKIKSIDAKAFTWLKRLKKLCLSNNKLSNIEIFNLEFLEALDLSYNQIELINGKNFYDLPQLKSLDLGSNLIELIGDLKFTNLEVFNLSRNQLAFIDKQTFENLKHLKKLDLSFNKISTICCLNLHILEDLDMSYNLIESLNVAYEFKNQLRKLDLSYNKISSLDEAHFSRFDQLENLNLNGNQISSIEFYAFAKLKNLKKLDLSYNQIKSLNKATFSNLVLKDLLLSGNELESIDDLVLKNDYFKFSNADVNFLEIKMAIKKTHGYFDIKDLMRLWFNNSKSNANTKHFTYLDIEYLSPKKCLNQRGCTFILNLDDLTSRTDFHRLFTTLFDLNICAGRYLELKADDTDFGSKIGEILANISRSLIKSLEKYDFFMFFIISHSNIQSHIYSIINKINEYESLKGKPKIYFIQSHTMPRPDWDFFGFKPSETQNKIYFSRDILIYQANILDNQPGSYLIDAFCEVFNKHAANHSFSNLITLINGNLQDKVKKKLIKKLVYSTITQLIYFKPKV